MKTFITFIAAVLTVITATAQDYYKDGELIKISDSVTLKCDASEDIIGLRGIKSYTYAEQDNNVASLKDRTVFKNALEETFTPEELEKYKDIILVIGVIHDASLKPVDIDFAFSRTGGDIPPLKFGTLRQKILESIEFIPVFKSLQLKPGMYYRWDEGLIAPIWYYRDAKYIDRGKKN